MIDKKIYKITIKGIAANSKTNNNITELIKTKIRIIFSFDFSCSPCFIFKENKGSFATKSKDKITVVPINNSVLNHIPYSSPIIGKDAMKIAAAGVGSPIKEALCLSLILNLAKRIAEKIGIKNPINKINIDS